MSTYNYGKAIREIAEQKMEDVLRASDLIGLDLPSDIEEMFRNNLQAIKDDEVNPAINVQVWERIVDTSNTLLPRPGAEHRFSRVEGILIEEDDRGNC